MRRILLAACVGACAIVHLAATQRGQLPSPGRGGTAPGWDRVVKLSDGRTLITDGGLSIDAALVKPASLPTATVEGVSAKRIEGFLAAQLPDEYRPQDLGSRSGSPPRYTSPSGVMLHGDYVDYLLRIIPAGRIRFRMKTTLDPVVILVDGKPAGLVMPMRSSDKH